MTDDEAAKLISEMMNWRAQHPDIATAITGCLARNDVTRLAHLPEEELVILHDACSAIAEMTEEGFYR